MKKPNITEGEWELNPKSLQENKENYFHISAEDRTSKNSLVQVVSWKHGYHPVKECTDRWKADAQAISAVPEMLDALVKIHSYVKENQPNYLLSSKYIQLHEIEQALKKAGCEL